MWQESVGMDRFIAWLEMCLQLYNHDIYQLFLLLNVQNVANMQIEFQHLCQNLHKTLHAWNKHTLVCTTIDEQW